MTAAKSDQDRLVKLAQAHGLLLDPASFRYNETGLDFQVVFGTDLAGQSWVLRIPRRPDAIVKAQTEVRALRLFASLLPVRIPDWRVFDSQLIAYPLLEGEPGLEFDAQTHEVTWNFDRQSEAYSRTLGAAIAALHKVSLDAAAQAGLPVHMPDDVRRRRIEDVEQVSTHFDVPATSVREWRAWIDDDSYWADWSVPVHGDLYAGHVLVKGDGTAVGLIDWTEARVDDPALDFAGHIRAFGDDSLPALMASYEAAGGRLWPRFADHCRLLNRFHGAEYARYAMTTGDPVHMKGAQSLLNSMA